jgi:hypothetical protein
MKIAKQFSRFDVWFLRGRLQFLYERHSGIEYLFRKRISWLDFGVDDKKLMGTISCKTFLLRSSCSIGHQPHSSASPVELRLRVGPRALSEKKKELR